MEICVKDEPLDLEYNFEDPLFISSNLKSDVIVEITALVKEAQIFLRESENEMKIMQDCFEKMKKRHSENLKITFQVLQLLTTYNVSSAVNQDELVNPSLGDISNKRSEATSLDQTSCIPQTNEAEICELLQSERPSNYTSVEGNNEKPDRVQKKLENKSPSNEDQGTKHSHAEGPSNYTSVDGNNGKPDRVQKELENKSSSNEDQGTKHSHAGETDSLHMEDSVSVGSRTENSTNKSSNAESTRNPSAKSPLCGAEDTSNLEFEDKGNRHHKRRRKHLRLLGEESSSEDEIIPMSKMRRSKNKCSSLSAPDPSITEKDINMINIQDFNNQAQDVPQSSSSLHHSPQALELSNKENLSSISVKSPTKESKINHNCPSHDVKEILTVLKKISSKFDHLLAHFPEKNIQESEDLSIRSSLPLGVDEFIKINGNLAENSSLRKKLTRILTTVEGRDSKALAVNILKKLLQDEAAEKYSLTGKTFKNALIKQSFEKTEVYKLILETCCQRFSNTKENTVREAVSDWLMHAKFRKNRRENRRNFSQEATLPEKTN